MSKAGPAAMREGGRYARAARGAALLLLLAHSAAGGEITCEAARVRVTAQDPEDVRAVCEGAAAASAFLSRLGVEVAAGIHVQVAGELPPEMPSTVIGCCSADGGRVYMLEYPEYAQRQRFLFDLPPDRALYAAVAAHEITHAVLLSLPGARRMGPIAHEYMAYVTMFASLPPGHRDRLLERYPADSRDVEALRSVDVLMLDPMRFGAAAHRHFESEPDQAAFVARVLAGQALAE
jgi:hypothetical protein